LADDRQQDAAGRHGLIDGLAKITAGSDGGDIHEDRVFAEVLHEVVEQAARFALRVVAPVTDENRAHHQRPLCQTFGRSPRGP